MKGILFRDVTTLFLDPRGFRLAVDQLLAPFVGQKIDLVAGLEARGFILGGAVAHQLSKGFVPIRKKGKLPGRTVEQDYELEYGSATVEMHDDAVEPGHKVLLVDDLLATGGTAEAGIRLIERLGGEVIGCAFVVDLPDLGGRRKLEDMGMSVHAICDLRRAVTGERGQDLLIRQLEPADTRAPATAEKVAPGLTARWRASSGRRQAVAADVQMPASAARATDAGGARLGGAAFAGGLDHGTGPEGRGTGAPVTRETRQVDRPIEHARRQPRAARPLVDGHPARPGAKAGETSPSSSPITARTLANP
jgi:adenine phosphoribosyltransferase